MEGGIEELCKAGTVKESDETGQPGQKSVELLMASSGTDQQWTRSLITEQLREIEVVGCDGLNAQRMAEAVQRLGARLIQTHPFINFQRVERLVVGADYSLAVHRYRALGEAFAADFMQTADHAEGLAFATEGGVIVIVAGQHVLGSMDAEPNKAAACARVVAHELCHGCDLGAQHPWLWAASQTHVPKTEGALYWLCQTLWSEYFANRYSYFCNPSLVDDWTRIELLIEHLPHMSPALAAARTASAFGYAMGSLAAAGATLQDVRPDIAQRLRSRGLWAAWFEACAATARLAQTNGCWETDSGMLQLTTAARLITNACRFRR